jgi:voltage-gated potassium channel
MGGRERPTLVRRILGERYTPLLVTMLLMFAMHPIANAAPTVRWGINVLFFAMVLSLLIAVERHGKAFAVLFALGALSALASLVGEFDRSTLQVAISGLLHFAFAAVLGAWIFGDVIRSKDVTMDAVFGACCTYMLMGVGWANLYVFIEALTPGSFSLGAVSITADGQPVAEVLDQLQYFSFVTLTTLGYGDITPSTLVAKYLSASEAIAGQLYIAIIIARLVAMEIASRASR